MKHSSPTGACPNCGRPLPVQSPAGHPPFAQCPQCGLPLGASVADRLQWVDGELGRLDRQRGILFAYRRRLLAEWQAGAPPAPGAAHAPGAAGLAREASPHAARNVLLVLGGVLLTVAALAFSLLSWGSMGIGGRAAVLATVTLVATGLPAVLLRRALHATAEAVAGVGLVLLLLDAYALRQVTLQDTDPLRYTAGAVAVVAVLWAAYGRVLTRTGAPGPGLRVPLPAAVVLGQLPVPLWAASAGAGTRGMAWALLVTAAADLLPALARAGRRPRSAVRTTAAVSALVTGGPALVLAGWLSIRAQDPPAAAHAGALLLTAAGVLLLALWPEGFTGSRRLARHLSPVALRARKGPPPLSHRASTTSTSCDPPPRDASPRPFGPGEAPLHRTPRASRQTFPATALAGRREKRFALPLGCVAGVLLIAASGGLVRTLVPSDAWVMPGYLLCGVVLAGVVVGLPSAPVRVHLAKQSPTAGLLGAAALMQGIAVLYGAPAVAQALLEPLGWAATPWQGAPHGAAGAALTPGRPWTGDAGTPVLFAVPALVLAVATRVPGLETVRRPAAAGALALGCAAAVVTPLALGLPYAAVTCWLVALVAGLLVLSTVVPAVSLTAALAALVTVLAATGWALADRTATFATMTLLGAAFAAATRSALRHAAAGAVGAAEGAGAGWASSGEAEPGSEAPGRGGPGDGPAAGATVSGATAGGEAGAGRPASLAAHVVRSALCAAAAVLCAAGLARALPAALGVPAAQAAFALLALAAATAPLAARLRTARPHLADPAQGEPPASTATPAGAAASLAVEGTGYAVAGWALALTATSAPLLALALGLCGVLAGGVALRADRRPAGYVATALFLLATWVRLYASEVSVPEAYGLPLAIAAFAVGVLRARRGPGLSSWTAYGPALSCAMLPSLVMVWGDPHWLRPLLLGAGALAVTLLGARLRLQAPLLCGGGVLALVAGHELAPYVTQVIGMLPRWLPPGLAGVLLLVVGATYEHRLRDARRLRAVWRRLG